MLVRFCAKVLSKEDLQRHNADFAVEASAIEREEAGEDDKDEHWEGLPEVRLGKRRAMSLEADEDDINELVEDVALAKQAKTSSDKLLDVQGPVSVRFSLNVFDFANNFVHSVIDVLGFSPSHPVSSRRGP